MAVAVTLIIALSLAAAVSARVSWTKRSETPNATISNMTKPARTSPSGAIKEMVARTSSRMTSGLRAAM